MKIVGISGEPIRACVKFSYCGFEISISTLMGVWPEMAIFGPEPGDGKVMPHEWTQLLMGDHVPYGKAENIVKAVAAIDNYLRSLP